MHFIIILMIYLTDTIGMDSGIVGTLMMVSKLFDGVTDIFFGSMIDKTKSRMGKARPWMLWAYIGCSAMIVMLFIVPAGASKFAQYAWFFVAYTLLNAVFYTANNIAYSALTSLITKNDSERVQMGSIRFMFAFGTSMLIPDNYSRCSGSYGRRRSRMEDNSYIICSYWAYCKYYFCPVCKGAASRRIRGQKTCKKGFTGRKVWS